MSQREDWDVPAGPPTEAATQVHASDRFWKPLLRGLKEKRVIPIVGQDLLTLPGRDVLYPSQLAERLAAQLGVSAEGLPQTGAINEVVLRYLEAAVGSADIDSVYGALYDLLAADTKAPIPEPLRKLAKIESFRLFVTTTFDPLLARALQEERSTPPVVVALTTRSKPMDLPETTDGTVVYQLLGHFNEDRDFAVTEEDLLEFLHILHKKPPERLFQALESNHLLLLGSSFSDWLARFFIRLTTLDNRLSQETRIDFIADPGLQGDPKLRLFLKHFCPYVRTYSGSLDQFIDELLQRAAAAAPEGTSAAVRPRSGRRQRTGVFLSYAREDLDTARTIRKALEQLNVKVWMDEAKLQPGVHFDEEIERRIQDSLLFMPLVSAATLAPGPRFFKHEWVYALDRATDFLPHETFIVPVVLDGTSIAEAEWSFRKLNALWLAQEASLAALASKLQACYRNVQAAQESRPRS